MSEHNCYFHKLDDGSEQMAVINWPDITFPIAGFKPEEGKLYTYTKVRHPEQKRYNYKGKNYVVCTATPIEEKKPLAGLGNAFTGL